MITLFLFALFLTLKLCAVIGWSWGFIVLPLVFLAGRTLGAVEMAVFLTD